MKKIYFCLFASLLFLSQQCTSTREKEILRIGVVADLTGPMAEYGKWVKEGVDIAYENAGGDSLLILIEDSKSDQKSAVLSAQKLLFIDKVDAIISGTGSSAVMAMAPIFNESEKILFVCLASSPSIAEAGMYIFRNRINGTYEATALAKYAETLNSKNIALVAINNEAGIPYLNSFENFATKSGIIKIVAEELCDPFGTNMRTLVLKLKKSEADVVFLALHIDQAMILFKSSIESGFNPLWIGISSIKSDKLFSLPEILKKNIVIASEGIYYNDPEYQQFDSIYFNRYNEHAGIYAVNGFDAVNIMKETLTKSRLGSEAIKTLLNTRFNGAGGVVNFDINGDAQRNIQLLRINSTNEFEVLTSISN